MKSNIKRQITILITLGIVSALLPIIIPNLIPNTGIINKNPEYSDDIDSDHENVKLSKLSGTIHINNNWTDARDKGICTGNGTYSEPYVIEDLIIDGRCSGSCIWIENSDVFFRIENCTVYNSTYLLNAGI